MSKVPDLINPRYLDEIGWFLYHEKYHRNDFGCSYDEERLAYSKMLLDEILRVCQKSEEWLKDKTVVTIGCGCTSDLATWPAGTKIAVDPLLGVYQQLGMLLEDEPDTSHSVYLTMGAEEIPLLNEFADLIICLNALDPMPHPLAALKEIWRVLKPEGSFYLDVDIGGSSTPDEPTVFSVESLSDILGDYFEIIIRFDNNKPNSGNRTSSSRILMRKKDRDE